MNATTDKWGLAWGLARECFAVLIDNGLYPSKVFRSNSDYIAVVIVFLDHKNKYADIECCGDGEILLGFIDRKKDLTIVEQYDSNSISDGIRKLMLLMENGE